MAAIPGPAQEPSLNEQVRIAEVTLSRLLEWVSRADNKASFAFGLQTAMLGVLAAAAPSSKPWNTGLTTLVATAVVFLALASYFIYRATFPRLGGPENSMIYFGGITPLGVQEFAARFASRTTPEYLADLLQQCHRNASIAAIKYKCVAIAYRFTVIAAFPWALSIYAFRSMR